MCVVCKKLPVIKYACWILGSTQVEEKHCKYTSFSYHDIHLYVLYDVNIN